MKRSLGPALVIGVVLLSGCASTAADEASCARPDASIVTALESRLTTPGSLRNAAVHELDSGLTFVTAELHERGDRADKEGKLLTWVVESAPSNEFRSVDVYARDHSSWPHADFDVRRDGAIDSRACAALRVGDVDGD